MGVAVGDTPLSYAECKALGYQKLHKQLVKMIAQTQRISRWFDAGERLNLLPALMAMRDLTAKPGRREPGISPVPDWTEECSLLGISANVVRQWKHRTAAETDIRNLLGEEPTTPKRAGGGTGNADAVKHLQRLVRAILNSSEDDAERLALAIAERYGF